MLHALYLSRMIWKRQEKIGAHRLLPEWEKKKKYYEKRQCKHLSNEAAETVLEGDKVRLKEAVYSH